MEIIGKKKWDEKKTENENENEIVISPLIKIMLEKNCNYYIKKGDNSLLRGQYN